MKILDRYILTSFLKTFFSVFIILMFIFVLQTIWLYIGELAGKDLDVEVILKFLLYFSPKLVPLVLPLTILLTSIMTFGTFAENYEFAAMKSSGISLQRAMRSLTFFIVLIGLVAFFFANNVIPAAEFKSINLRKNIAQLKPAMAITEGVFNDIGDFNIKVEEKSGDNDRYLTNVIIHKKTQIGGNHTVIKANEGELVGSTDSDVLSLILREGNYYDEVQASDYEKRKRKPFAKSYFDEYVINIDLSNFNNVDLEDETYSSTHGMLKISELNESIDSFSVTYNERMDLFQKDMYRRTGVENLKVNYKPKDTLVVFEDGVLSHYNTYDGSQIANLALGSVNSALAHLNLKKQEFKNSVKQINKFEIALHEKYVLAIACIVLFFVGAPLGAIIRKGGLGLPIVVAIILFLTYHFIGIFAKNSAEDGSISPFIATWLSTWIMLPLGIYLTYRATTDQGLFAIDNLLEPFKKLIKSMGFNKSEADSGYHYEILKLDVPVSIETEEAEKLRSKDTEELKKIVQFYRKYKLSSEYRLAALQILETRGVTQEELLQEKKLYDDEYLELDRLYLSVKNAFKSTNILFILFYIFLFAASFVNISFHQETPAMILSIISIICAILFYIYLYSLDSKARRIDEILKKENISFSAVLLFLGIAFYILFYFQYKKEIKNLAGIVKS